MMSQSEHMYIHKGCNIFLVILTIQKILLLDVHQIYCTFQTHFIKLCAAMRGKEEHLKKKCPIVKKSFKKIRFPKLQQKLITRSLFHDLTFYQVFEIWTKTRPKTQPPSYKKNKMQQYKHKFGLEVIEKVVLITDGKEKAVTCQNKREPTVCLPCLWKGSSAVSTQSLRNTVVR